MCPLDSGRWLKALPIALIAVWFVFAASLGAQKEKKAPPAEPLNLNTATVEDLAKLPEIGEATARAIVRFREKSGPFRRVEDLLAVRGITKRRLEKLRPFITVAERPPKAQKTP